jgi:hypothetical protein
METDMNEKLVNRVCTINDAVGEDAYGSFDTDFRSKTETTAFMLEDMSFGGGLVGFKACYVGKNPPRFWRSPICFVRRGSAAPKLPDGSHPPLLPPWVPGDTWLRQQYVSALNNLLSWADEHPSFYRFEGDVMFEVAEAVTLYLFPAGMVNDKDFALIRVMADQDGVGLRQSGIGHGNF